MTKQVLVTAALPYANGAIHLGHLLEAIQTDVYVRARKLGGDDCVFMWADDTHGTPIELRARREGITPEALIERAYAEHVQAYTDFGIGFDIFHTTHGPETKVHAEAIFAKMRDRGDITQKSVEQFYCPVDKMFLPDRFVKGTCPKCKSPDQYGDSCEVCGSTYAPTELGDPRCSICGTTPELRSSVHLFVPLDRHEAFLREWLSPPEQGGKTVLQPTVRNYVMEWVEGGLRDWDISRDPPYFGFEIPGHPGKYFYVWFDAPIGYIGATQKYCADHGRDFDRYWRDPSREHTEVVHVIGKDIVYFHCLFWPAMLHAAGYTTPSRVHVHGWLTVAGEKMSKTRGTFVLARTYLDHLPPDYLRYYFASKLSAAQDDIDLNLEDFVFRCNADLVKKAANLASRCCKFVSSRLGGTLAALPEDAAAIVADARRRIGEAACQYYGFESAKALRLAMQVAEDFNLYVTEQAPWKLKDDERARAICSAGVYATQVIATILKPALPGWAAKVERMLRLPAPLDFHNGGEPLPAGHAIGDYETLAEPIDPAKVAAIIEASKESTPAAPREQGGNVTENVATYEVEPLAAEVGIDEFGKIDLRVAKVKTCDRVEGADKLLQLLLDVGPLGERTVFSGIAKSYAPESLVGKHVVLFANLKARKMRFGTSEGMILASGATDDAVKVLELDPASRPGDRVS
jgi:methionyl-tRNA synthetase